jgi:trk system potassium uptake protein TrkH
MKLVWTSFVAFITSLAVLTLVLSAAGIPFIGALMAGVGALSNIGPIYDFVHLDLFPSAPSYADMTTLAKLSLSAGMILGRLEIVAFLSLLSMFYWRQ